MKSIFTCLFIALGFAAFAQGTINLTLEHDGLQRSFILHMPPSFDGTTQMPLVITLHGLGDSADNMQNVGFKQLGDQYGFISVYPQGEQSLLGNAWNNGTPVPGFTVDDVGFISALIDFLITDYAVDPARVYACGYSMGGIMSHRLACELDTKIAAIASMAGVMSTATEGSCAPGRAVPVLHMHGNQDGTVPYDGNATFGLTSVAATIAKWQEVNGCPETPTTEAIPDSAADGYTISLDHYTPCTDDTEVKLYTVDGADHTWLGLSNDISTTVTFWEFFEQHEHPSPSVVSVFAPVNELDLTVIPNPASETIQIPEANENHTVQIMDFSGKIIFTGNGGKEINVASFARGMYSVRITENNSGKTGVQKLVIQ